jgi:hypothetical protein
MGLSDDLRTDTKRPPWQVCGVRWVLEQVEPGDRVTLEGALLDVSVSGDRLASAIGRHLSLPVSGETVRRHRRGSCRCTK